MVTTTINLDSCPRRVQSFNTSVIILGTQSEHNAEAQDDNILIKAVDNWMSAGVSQCKRKFENEPADSVTLDQEGKESTSWFCSGIRSHS